MNFSFRQFFPLFTSAIVLLFLAASFTACEKETLLTVDEVQQTDLGTTLEKSGRIIHRVSVGSPDACEALGEDQGCDANFSLIALMHADGTVKGQYHDQLRGETNGLHIDVDCLIVDGNSAIVGGVITKGDEEGAYQVGNRVVTAVWDNGTSSNDDPDAISFSYPVSRTCNNYNINQFAVLNLTAGQVKVK